MSDSERCSSKLRHLFHAFQLLCCNFFEMAPKLIKFSEKLYFYALKPTVKFRCHGNSRSDTIYLNLFWARMTEPQRTGIPNFTQEEKECNTRHKRHTLQSTDRTFHYHPDCPFCGKAAVTGSKQQSYDELVF